jgi:mannose-6-phosphate isomerase-like protein (cupin superfamily)
MTELRATGTDDVAPCLASPVHIDSRTIADPTADIIVSQRPWGEFMQLACNSPVTIKIITIEPGQRLSLQRHEHRGELWQVLDGPIDVTIGTFERMVTAGEIVWIPQGTVHRMTNCGETRRRVLEVAFGAFDEDDIERLDDDYGR